MYEYIDTRTFQGTVPVRNTALNMIKICESQTKVIERFTKTEGLI